MRRGAVRELRGARVAAEVRAALEHDRRRRREQLRARGGAVRGGVELHQRARARERALEVALGASSVRLRVFLRALRNAELRSLRGEDLREHLEAARGGAERRHASKERDEARVHLLVFD